MLLAGRAMIYGDDINTDLIYPGRYTYILLTEEQMGEHALEDLDPEFKNRDARGGILVAGRNFGCGSAREQAVKCLKQRGIRVILAKSFSRIYYRNCINEGLLPVVCPKAVAAAGENDVIEVDVEQGSVKVNGNEFSFPKYPEYVLQIIEAGGLIESVKARFADRK